MRRRADRQRIERFWRELGRLTKEPTTLYLSGGATAVLYGWRSSTIDIDVRFEPERDELLRGTRPSTPAHSAGAWRRPCALVDRRAGEIGH